ncbi:hypothetical protein QTP86_032537, partial [Hemibagrus guttatus]
MGGYSVYGDDHGFQTSRICIQDMTEASSMQRIGTFLSTGHKGETLAMLFNCYEMAS